MERIGYLTGVSIAIVVSSVAAFVIKMNRQRLRRGRGIHVAVSP